jgi:hypothetical protein
MQKEMGSKHKKTPQKRGVFIQHYNLKQKEIFIFKRLEKYP